MKGTEFKASLVYIESLRPARAHSKNIFKRKKKLGARDGQRIGLFLHTRAKAGTGEWTSNPTPARAAF